MKKKPLIFRKNILFTILFLFVTGMLLQYLGYTTSQIGTAFIVAGVYSLLLKWVESKDEK